MAKLILISDFSEAASRRLVTGISQYVHEMHEAWNFSFLPIEAKEHIGLEAIVKQAKSVSADAVIGHFEPTDDLNLFRNNGIIVIAQDYKTRFSDIPNITSNYYESGRICADYFLKKGFESFAFYGPEDRVSAVERQQGFKDTVLAAKPDAKFSSLMTRSSIWGYDSNELTGWIRSLPKPVAIMAGNDRWGYYVTEAVERLGHNNPKNRFRIPEDIAVVGVDNDEPICKLSSPNLSSLDLEFEKAGYKVARFINEMILNPQCEPRNIYIESASFKTRQSSEILVNDDPHIETVLKYIHANINHKILVNDIVKQVPLSRRLLETRFREKMGVSICTYIKNIRIEKMTNMLRNGKTVSEATFALGFGDIKNISRIFKSVEGVPPSKYIK